jgi:hypothetical protein
MLRSPFSAQEVKTRLPAPVIIDGAAAAPLASDLRQILDDLGLGGSVWVEFEAEVQFCPRIKASG